MEGVVRRHRGVHVSGSDRLCEALVLGSHRAHVRCREMAHAEFGGEGVERGHDRVGVAASLRSRARRGVSVRLRLDQAVFLEACERLTDRRPAEAQAEDQLGVAQPLTGCEGAIDDRDPKDRVGLVAEQEPLNLLVPR